MSGNIKVKTIVPGGYAANCHLVYSDESPNLLIIDPGGDFLKIKAEISLLKKERAAILLTHCHYDHVAAVYDLQKTGIPVYMSRSDERNLNDYNSAAFLFGENLKPFKADNRLIGGDFYILDYKVRVLETPGHTRGGLCFIIGDALFSGDTLFKNGYGRYDLPGGNPLQLKSSLDMLFSLDKDYAVYCGHGENTTLFYERENNPAAIYLR